MSNVVPLSLARRPPPPVESRLVRRIRTSSRALERGFSLLAAASVLMGVCLIIAFLLYRGEALRIGPTSMWLGSGSGPAGFRAVSSLPLAQRLAYAIVAVIRLAPAVLILLWLRRLFGRYADGRIFDELSAAQIQRIGVWLCADAAAPLAGHLFLGATHLEIDHVWFHFESVQELVLGALVFVVALVMRHGRAIEDERAGFV